MGGIVSSDNANRYDSVSEEFVEEVPNSNIFGRRRSRKLSIRNLDAKSAEDKVRSDFLAVPCGNRHPFADYRFNKKLGAGAFSIVYKATSVYNDTAAVAIKEVRTIGLNKEQLNDLQTEMNILSQSHHKNIVNLTAVFFVPEKIFLVMDYLRGGELLKAICKRNFYEERDAKRIMIQISDALRYIHVRGVVHRDIKPENIILETKDFYSPIKLVDFGFAVVVEDLQNRTKKYVKGTPGYMAPEVVSSAACTTAVDIWSLGVVLYILLSGTMPFDAKNKDSVLTGKYQFPSRLWSNVSAEAKDLISKMLVMKPEERIAASEIFSHPWITSYYDDPLSGTVAANYISDNREVTTNDIAKQVAAKLGQQPGRSQRNLAADTSGRSGKAEQASTDELAPVGSASVSGYNPPEREASIIGRQYRSPSLLHPIAEIKENSGEHRSQKDDSDSDDENAKKAVAADSDDELDDNESASKLPNADAVMQQLQTENLIETQYPDANITSTQQMVRSGTMDRAEGVEIVDDTDGDSVSLNERSPRTSAVSISTQFLDRSPRTSGADSSPYPDRSPRTSASSQRLSISSISPSGSNISQASSDLLPGDLSRALHTMQHDLGIRVLGQVGIAVTRFKHGGINRDQRRRSCSNDINASHRTLLESLEDENPAPSVVADANENGSTPMPVSNNTRSRSSRSFSVSCVAEEAVDISQLLKKQNSFNKSTRLAVTSGQVQPS